MNWLKTKNTPISLIIHDKLYLFVVQKTGKNYTVNNKNFIPAEHAGIVQSTVHNPSFLAHALFTFLKQQKIKKPTLAILIPKKNPEHQLYYHLWSAYYGVPITHISTHDLDHTIPDESYCAQLACALWQGDVYAQ